MLGFNALGRMGRLGNQMFQYAALKGIARSIGTNVTIPLYTDAVNDGIGNMLRTELFDSFDLRTNIGLLDSGQATTVHERHFHFDSELLVFPNNDDSPFFKLTLLVGLIFITESLIKDNYENYHPNDSNNL
jgi:hypothetical protein